MSKRNAYGPHPKKSYTYRELPIGSTSIGVHDDVIKTGAWRARRPAFRMKAPPCSEACPAGVDVRAFISLMGAGEFEAAHQLYVEENPFPAVCGRVCFHPCEDACNRKDFDKAIAINALERFLAGFDVPGLLGHDLDGGRVAVVGSGPAGLSCSHFLARLRHRVTVFEALGEIGGLLRTGIPSYRLPVEIVENEVEKLRALGVQFKTFHRINEENWRDLEEFDAVMMAFGASRHVTLPFTQLDGLKKRVLSGLDFLKIVKLGGSPSLGHQVAVIGGGNTAIDAARVALRLGASPKIIYRRTRAEMPAFPSEIDAALDEGVDILYLTSPVALKSRESGVRIECIKNQMGEPDQDGRRVPIPAKGSEFCLEVDTVILAIGEAPDLSFLPADTASSNGLVCVDALGSTSLSGVYAAGDLVAQPRSVAHAIGSGKAAAIAIDCYVRGYATQGLARALRNNVGGTISIKHYLEGKDWAESQQVSHFEALNSTYFQHQERPENVRIPPVEARTSFEEVCSTLPMDQVLKEAKRCFSCGLCCECDNCYLFCPDGSVLKQDDGSPYVIDYDFCKGCGICANECPVGFIDMGEEK